MNKISFRLIGLLTAILWFASATFFFGGSSAQTSQQNQNTKPRSAATPQTTPNVKPSATVTPTPANGGVIEDTDEGPIRIESDLVNLSVRVVDRDGRIVSDVRPDEFKVFENGVEQPIDFVSKEDVPINYGLVVDNSGSLRQQIDKVIEAGKTLINANKPADAAFVIRFISSDKIEVLQEFTKNKTDLNEALENMYPEGGQTAITDAVMLAAEKAADYEKGKRSEDKSRRALVLITDGEDRDSYYKNEELFRTLRESDVQIYTIGFVNDLSKESGLIKKSDREKAVKYLERMAQETGGKAYFPASLDELSGIANQINNELRTQYSIGYAPTNTAQDGSFRAIKVTVKDDAKRGRRIPVTKTGRTAPKS